MDLHLRGKRVLITGASKGIGAAAAEAFAEEGCHLMLAARNGDQLKAVAERLRSAHQIDATTHVVDLRKPEDIVRLVKDAADIDILVNNAGDIPGGSVDKIDEPTWRHAWELKVFGYINITRAIYAQMKSRGHGVIVNDIGVAGEKFDANYICGSAGNAALMAFTRALGGKSLADNIRVVGINPGPVGTDRHVTLLKTRAKNQLGDENRYKEFQKGLPLGRPAHAREIGDLMAFLASDRSGYTSGVIYTVDGGISAGWGVGAIIAIGASQQDLVIMPRFTALDADPARLDAHEQNYVANIRKHGWAGTHVAAEKNLPSFSYTSGFWLKFEFPELIVFGLEGKVAHDTFWHMYRTLEAGQRFAVGTREDEIFENVPAVLLAVSPRHYRNYLGWNQWFYGNDKFECLQLIFPDIDGHFPWEGSVCAAPNLSEGNWSGLRHH